MLNQRLQAYYAYMGINKQDDIVIIDDSEEIKDVDDIIENETIDVEEEVIVKRESVADIRREMRNARNQELKVIITVIDIGIFFNCIFQMKTKNINNENVNRDRIKFSDEERILKKEELKSRTEVLLKK